MKGNPESVPRGKCQGFSRSSRRNMIRQCAKMGTAIPVFLTLTYGEKYPSDPAEWKNHLASWGKRLKRYNPELSAIWRLEPQKRGAPHYHLLIYRKDGKKPFLPKEWIAKSWSSVLGDYSSDDHLKAGTRIESLRSSRGAAFYVAKYCAKLPEDGDFPPEWERAGRLWGSFNKAALPQAKQFQMVLHSAIEQKATLFVMHDAYKAAYMKKAAADYVKSGGSKEAAFMAGERAWAEGLEKNEYLGNTATVFSDAESFIKQLAAKIGYMECMVNDVEGKDMGPSVMSDFVDRAAAAF